MKRVSRGSLNEIDDPATEAEERMGVSGQRGRVTAVVHKNGQKSGRGSGCGRKSGPGRKRGRGLI